MPAMKSKNSNHTPTFRCVYCGELNHTFVDASQGKTQQYIEDCQICCRPNDLSINYDKWNKEFIIQASPTQ